MFIFCQEFPLSLSSFRIRKVNLCFIQWELIGGCSHLELRTTKQTLSSCFIFHYDRFFLSKSVFFIISFLSHVVFQFRAASNRLNLFRLNIKVTFCSFSEIERRLMIPLRFLILKLLKYISLNWRFLSYLCSFNKWLYQTIWLLKIWFFKPHKSFNCILAFPCSKRVASKLSLKYCWCHLIRHPSYLRDRSLFHMFCCRVDLRSIKVSWWLVIVISCDYCYWSSRTYFRDRSETRGTSVQVVILDRNFIHGRLFQRDTIDHSTWEVVCDGFLDLLYFKFKR